MCKDCGCSGGPAHAHTHGHGHHHEHAPAPASRTVEVRQAVLSENDRLAERNRGYFAAKGMLVINVVSSPGSGKTALLERTLTDLKRRVPVAVIVGDLATDNILVGGRLLYAVVVEDNMNLYAIGGGSLLSQDGSNGLRLEPALGAEYFPFGVENLGVNGEVGLRMDLGDALGIGTTAAFGLTYWF